MWVRKRGYHSSDDEETTFWRHLSAKPQTYAFIFHKRRVISHPLCEPQITTKFGKREARYFVVYLRSETEHSSQTLVPQYN
jgi:hypothetical protein